MSANYMLLKSCKIFKKAEAVTSRTPFKEIAYLVIQSCLNVRHESEEDWQKNKIENTKVTISNLTVDEVLPEYTLDSR